jgi:arginase family enzyme
MTEEAPTFALPSGFLGLAHADRDASICIAGIPFDVATTNRSDARSGPQAIRHASRMLRDGAHPKSFVDPLKQTL